ncbi:MAG: alpha-galactosidase [Gorillibacterium sp.]|nr:alpha-galactosidase [Gorillibacterium sp.]
MPIHYDQQNASFHLYSQQMSYVIEVVNGYPVHAYWGKKLRQDSNLNKLAQFPQRASLDRLPQEYPQYGSGDFRSPAYQLQLADGTRITELVYKAHRIFAGKLGLEGLPAVYTEADNEATTLELELTDGYSDLTVTLSYTIFAELNVLTRSVKLTNDGGSPVRLLRALSASVDIHAAEFEVVYLSGAWTREGQIERRPIGPGGTRIESRRGASGHALNPFLALVSPNTDEDQGEVYGFSLIYSGNFVAQAEVDPFQTTRVSIGINPFDFSWIVAPGESFQTPEAVLVYASAGLGEMSRTYHRLYRTRLCRGVHRDQQRPILVNNWEATYFDFTADKIEAIAEAGAELGIELFVLDDGWFGKRNDDTTSLGDWVVDLNKLPNGLTDLAERVNKLGLKFGLWVEPEMVSPDSDLYRAHPDWCLHVPGRRRSEARTQLVLDLSRQDVREYLFEALGKIFSTVPVAYVKWDMNRNMTEIGSAALPADQQAEVNHRNMLGLYELLERLVGSFPDILFESCSSGGGRFDPGMLYYMPQTWTSDNTDAMERLKIQYGLSLIYPVSTIGAHVSASPNHQVGRLTPLTTRGDVAMSGNFGYELDLTKFTDEEKAIVKTQVSLYKEIRPLVQTGDLYRLKNPFSGNHTSWMFVSENREDALVFYFRVMAEPNPARGTLQLKGLNPDLDYAREDVTEVMGGDRLMQAGIPIPELKGDFASTWFRLKAVH